MLTPTQLHVQGTTPTRASPSTYSPRKPGSAKKFHGLTSPTDSMQSERPDDLASVRSWDEKQVAFWLHSIKCGQYESMFRSNNFNGDNLLECDQKILQEMGVKKVGDRVRIFVAIKQLRNKSAPTSRQKNLNTLAALEATALSNPSRYSRTSQLAETGFLPRSPLDHPPRSPRPQPHVNSPSGGSSSGRTPAPSNESKNSQARNPSFDGLTMGHLIRVIYTGGRTKVLDIQNCDTSDEITMRVLKKLQLPESQYKEYCFYVLDPVLSKCRKLPENELEEICASNSMSERGRLILRNIHAGEPDDHEIYRASQLAFDESQAAHEHALKNSNSRQKQKIQQITGESWQNIKQPLVPSNRPPELKLGEKRAPNDERKNTGAYHSGQRPPSEWIIHELQTYFPSHRETLEKTVRRSQRMSRAASRMSVVSNYSVASSMKDAPPIPPLPQLPAIPSIADQWLQGSGTPPGTAQSNQAPRHVPSPRVNVPPQTPFRGSIGSLQPLQEESPLEPNRKSYVSFTDNSETSAFETDNPDSLRQSFEDLSLTATDGEEDDDDLADFMAGGNNFAPKNWMKGALIGEGSFGSVFLALHAITGELMAVKQVEVPSATKGTEYDRRKNLMIAALKQEIELLQGMSHVNIVQYLGTVADDQHLNIFLEYVPGGSIATMLKQYNNFQEPLVKKFVRQILAGLSYLHRSDIIHRDIKGANILVDNKGGVKISDFGISKRVEASHVIGARASVGGGHARRPSLQGTVFWMAPEVLKQTAHTTKADIWSLGCLIIEMLTGAHPFPDSSQVQAMFQIGNNQAPKCPDGASKELQDLLADTFNIDYEKRPTADELLEYEFLTSP